MKLSARNQLKGKIVSIDKGAVNGIVRIDIGGDNVIESRFFQNFFLHAARPFEQ